MYHGARKAQNEAYDEARKCRPTWLADRQLSELRAAEPCVEELYHVRREDRAARVPPPMPCGFPPFLRYVLTILSGLVDLFAFIMCKVSARPYESVRRVIQMRG